MADEQESIEMEGRHDVSLSDVNADFFRPPKDSMDRDADNVTFQSSTIKRSGGRKPLRRMKSVSANATVRMKSRIDLGLNEDLEETDADGTQRKTPSVMKRVREFHSDKYVRWQNLLILIAVLIGVVLVVLQQEFSWNYYTHSLESNFWSEILKWAISIDTGVLLALITCYYIYQIVIRKRATQWSGYSLSTWSVIRHSNVFWSYLAEIVVCSIHAPPFLPVNNKAGLFVFLRLYTAVRVLRDWSPAYRLRAEIVDSAKGSAIATGIKSKFNWVFGLKWMFYAHTVMFVLGTMILGILIWSYCIFVTERERNQSRIADGIANLFDYASSTYFTIVTMTTVGYGDMTPLSDWGRGVSMLAALTGMVMSSFLIATLSSRLNLEPREEYGILYLQMKKYQKAERKSAADLVIFFIKHAAQTARRLKRQREARARGNQMRERRASSLAYSPGRRGSAQNAPKPEKDELREAILRGSSAKDSPRNIHSKSADESSGQKKTLKGTSFATQLMRLIKTFRRSRRDRMGCELALNDMRPPGIMLDELSSSLERMNSRLTVLEEQLRMERKKNDLNDKVDKILELLSGKSSTNPHGQIVVAEVLNVFKDAATPAPPPE